MHCCGMSPSKPTDNAQCTPTVQTSHIQIESPGKTFVRHQRLKYTMSGDGKYKVVSKKNDDDNEVKRGLTEYEASIKIGKFFRVKEKLRFLARKKKNTQEWWKTSNGGTKRKSNEETETSEKKSKVESCLETISISMSEVENRKSALTKRNVQKAQKMKQTKAEKALRQVRKDLNDLEKKHNEMRRKYEKEIKKLNARLKSISSSSKKDAGKKMHTKNSLAAVFTSSEANAIKTQFESLTGLCVEPDQKSPHKLQCTVLNRTSCYITHTHTHTHINHSLSDKT